MLPLLQTAGTPTPTNSGSAKLEIVSEIAFPFTTPYALAVDANDNVYVSDGCFFRRKDGSIDTGSDTFSIYLGGNFANYPDCGIPNYRILKFDKNGSYVGWIGKGTDGISGFHSAAGSQTAVRTYATWLGGWPTPASWTAGELNRIRSLAVDSDGTLYAMEANRIHRFTGTDHTFAGTMGWLCDTTCQNLIAPATAANDNAINNYYACVAPLDPSDNAGFQACYNTYIVEIAVFNQLNTQIHNSILAAGASAWRTDPTGLIVDFAPLGTGYIGANHTPNWAAGLAINGTELWTGMYSGGLGGEIRVFDKTTAALTGWYGRSRYIVNNFLVSQHYGYQPVSAYFDTATDRYIPVHDQLHGSQPGAFHIPRSLQWHDNLLYVADNTSDPVLSVAQRDGTIVRSRSHGQGDKPFALTVNPAGYVLTSNMYTGAIEIFDPALKLIGSLQVDNPSQPNQWYPVAAAAFAWSSDGFVFFTSTTKNKVYKARLVL